jgi:hypothetical protein
MIFNELCREKAFFLLRKKYKISPQIRITLALLIFKREIIDAHGLKIQGRGYLMLKPLGGSRLTGKIAWGVPLFRVLLHFYLQVF